MKHHEHWAGAEKGRAWSHKPDVDDKAVAAWAK